MGEKQREISVSEFFTKNRHLLGFDNPRKALLTTVKEAVDNSLDACEEAKILPEVKVEIKEIKEGRYTVMVQDNGPGIVKKQIPKIFGKLLYGSKFHKMSQSRGQQGIGISAAAMYAQLTTGKSVRITSRIGKRSPVYYYELHLNTKKNEPEIVKEKEVEWELTHGTKIELELEAKFQKGKQGIDEFLSQTAIANPHATIDYVNPLGEKMAYPNAIKKLPIEPKEIKPHPYGIELGVLISMLKDTAMSNITSFLQKEFCRVSPSVAKKICEAAKIPPRARPSRIARQEAENLYKTMQKTKIMAPPTNCLSPIGEDALLKSLKKEVDAEFYATVTRAPSVYRGNPFLIEAGIAYGGALDYDGPARVLRLANRVPLQYQQGGGAIQKAIVETAWKNYSLSQSRGALPQGPVIIVVHMASVWVPFTSESKEAIASYDAIIKEMRLAIQECGRKLGTFINKRKKMQHEAKKKSHIEKYLPFIGDGLQLLLTLGDKEKEKVNNHLGRMLDESRPIKEIRANKNG